MKKFKLSIIVTVILALLTTVFIFSGCSNESAAIYEEALELWNSNDHKSAAFRFNEIKGYQDSDEYIETFLNEVRAKLAGKTFISDVEEEKLGVNKSRKKIFTYEFIDEYNYIETYHSEGKVDKNKYEDFTDSDTFEYKIWIDKGQVRISGGKYLELAVNFSGYNNNLISGLYEWHEVYDAHALKLNE